LRRQWAWQVTHIENVLPEPTDVLAHVGAEAGDQAGGDGMPALGHVRQNCGQVRDIGQHDRIGDGWVLDLALRDAVRTAFYRLAPGDYGFRDVALEFARMAVEAVKHALEPELAEELRRDLREILKADS
jgi:hypothetical protein